MHCARYTASLYNYPFLHTKHNDIITLMMPMYWKYFYRVLIEYIFSIPLQYHLSTPSSTLDFSIYQLFRLSTQNQEFLITSLPFSLSETCFRHNAEISSASSFVILGHV